MCTDTLFRSVLNCADKPQKGTARSHQKQASHQSPQALAGLLPGTGVASDRRRVWLVVKVFNLVCPTF